MNMIIWLNGHQIIGELRRYCNFGSMVQQLNGHQIIGELRLKFSIFIFVYFDWMVTRSLVSYIFRLMRFCTI